MGKSPTRGRGTGFFGGGVGSRQRRSINGEGEYDRATVFSAQKGKKDQTSSRRFKENQTADRRMIQNRGQGRTYEAVQEQRGGGRRGARKKSC